MSYVASDGKAFKTAKDYRKYEMKLRFTFSDKKNETLVKNPGEIAGQPFEMSNLESCEIQILDFTEQIQIDDLKNCKVLIGACSSSLFIRNCQNCVFYVATRQLRTRDCSDCVFSLYVMTEPIIETSNNMAFANYSASYAEQRQHFELAGLNPTINNWSKVYDFNDDSKSQNHWHLLYESGEPPHWSIKNHTGLAVPRSPPHDMKNVKQVIVDEVDTEESVKQRQIAAAREYMKQTRLVRTEARINKRTNKRMVLQYIDDDSDENKRNEWKRALELIQIDRIVEDRVRMRLLMISLAKNT